MDRFTWAVAAGVLALVAASLATAVALQSREVVPDLSTPGGVVLAYAQALQRGEAERAWELLAPSVQARVTRDQFLLRTTHLRGGLYERARLSVEDVRLEGDEARLELVRTYTSRGGFLHLGLDEPYSERSPVRLVRQDGAWRISVPPDPFLVLER